MDGQQAIGVVLRLGNRLRQVLRQIRRKGGQRVNNQRREEKEVAMLRNQVSATKPVQLDEKHLEAIIGGKHVSKIKRTPTDLHFVNVVDTSSPILLPPS